MILVFTLLNTHPRSNPLRASGCTQPGSRRESLIYRTQSTLCCLRFPAATPAVRRTSGSKLSSAALTLPGNNIGINHSTAQLPEHSHHRALPRRDAPREADQEHRVLKRREKDLGKMSGWDHSALHHGLFPLPRGRQTDGVNSSNNKGQLKGNQKGHS